MIHLEVDCIAEVIDITVGLYATAAASAAGSQPFATFHAWPDYLTLLGQTIDVRAAAYLFLASLPSFSGATSV